MNIVKGLGLISQLKAAGVYKKPRRAYSMKYLMSLIDIEDLKDPKEYGI